jgi:hypothetical protein
MHFSFAFMFGRGQELEGRSSERKTGNWKKYWQGRLEVKKRSTEKKGCQLDGWVLAAGLEDEGRSTDRKAVRWRGEYWQEGC